MFTFKTLYLINIRLADFTFVALSLLLNFYYMLAKIFFIPSTSKAEFIYAIFVNFFFLHYMLILVFIIPFIYTSAFKWRFFSSLFVLTFMPRVKKEAVLRSNRTESWQETMLQALFLWSQKQKQRNIIAVKFSLGTKWFTNFQIYGEQKKPTHGCVEMLCVQKLLEIICIC